MKTQSSQRQELEIIGRGIVDCCLTVHKSLGPGLLESAYEECLAYELVEAGFDVKRQAPMPLIYKDVKMEMGYRIDLLIENRIIIEVKAVEALHDVHLAQILTYLKLAEKQLGFLVNFNVPLMRNGIRRVVNNLKP